MKNISQIPCVCVLRTRRSVWTFCQDSKIVSVAIQNSKGLKHLRKLQSGIAVIDFTMKSALKNSTKYPVYSMFIERKYSQQEA